MGTPTFLGSLLTWLVPPIAHAISESQRLSVFAVKKRRRPHAGDKRIGDTSLESVAIYLLASRVSREFEWADSCRFVFELIHAVLGGQENSTCRGNAREFAVHRCLA